VKKRRAENLEGVEGARAVARPSRLLLRFPLSSVKWCLAAVPQRPVTGWAVARCLFCHMSALIIILRYRHESPRPLTIRMIAQVQHLTHADKNTQPSKTCGGQITSHVRSFDWPLHPNYGTSFLLAEEPQQPRTTIVPPLRRTKRLHMSLHQRRSRMMPASHAAPCTAIKLVPSNSCHKIDRSTAIGLALMPPSTGSPTPHTVVYAEASSCVTTGNLSLASSHRTT
jgi:hypothetical protein